MPTVAALKKEAAARGKVMLSDGRGGALPPLTMYGESVVAHGADPTGVADSSAAFREAAEESLFLYVPPGRYRAHGIPLRSGAHWLGCGGGFVNEPGPISSIVTDGDDMFVASSSPSAITAGVTFRGLSLGNSVGGGHVLNLGAGLVMGLSLEHVYFDIQAPNKSAVYAHLHEIDRSRFSMWGVNTGAAAAPVIDIVASYATANVFEDATLNMSPLSTAYAMHFESAVFSNSNSFARLLFEAPCGGAIKLLSAQNTTLDQLVVVPEGYTPLTEQAYIHIGKSATGADSARIAFRGGWSDGGTATNPNIRLCNGTSDVSLEALYAAFVEGNGNPVRIVTSQVGQYVDVNP